MTPSKGEVWLVNLDPTVGDDIRKQRPAVVVSRNALGMLALRVVVPITAWQPRFQGSDWLVHLAPNPASGLDLDKESAADSFQVRSVSSRRFIRRLRRLTDADAQRVAAGLRVALEL